MNKDPYKVLELPEDASFDQIKDRYRHLSKLLHPDKQPLENYQMAQEQFKQIDEAFKSISSGLRRHVYKHFGYPGIRVLDACPYEFQAFEKANLLDPKVQNELTQLIYYFLLEEHASMEHEKNKLKSRTVFTAVSSRDPITRIPKMDRYHPSYSEISSSSKPPSPISKASPTLSTSSKHPRASSAAKMPPTSSSASALPRGSSIRSC